MMMFYPQCAIPASLFSTENQQKKQNISCNTLLCQPMRPKARAVALAGVLFSVAIGRRKPDSTVLEKDYTQMRAAANFSCGHIVFFILKAPSTLTSRLADPLIFLVDPCDLSGSNSSGQPADRRIYNCKKWPVGSTRHIKDRTIASPTLYSGKNSNSIFIYLS
jgi:hypothetical protein